MIGIKTHLHKDGELKTNDFLYNGLVISTNTAYDLIYHSDYNGWLPINNSKLRIIILHLEYSICK